MEMLLLLVVPVNSQNQESPFPGQLAAAIASTRAVRAFFFGPASDILRR
jgi:hypothetical protein